MLQVRPLATEFADPHAGEGSFSSYVTNSLVSFKFSFIRLSYFDRMFGGPLIKEDSNLSEFYLFNTHVTYNVTET